MGDRLLVVVIGVALVESMEALWVETLEVLGVSVILHQG